MINPSYNTNDTEIKNFLRQLNLPQPNSHKGDNGKLLIIGGSKLFHAASRWSLEIASRFVDMVFYSSAPNNNRLILKAKSEFWDGIVVPRNELGPYLKEADCILIGPGMERSLSAENKLKEREFYLQTPPTKKEWDTDTQKVTNYLIAKYPQKKWVVDAGALQMINPHLLNKNCIITPHQQELQRLIEVLNLEAPTSLNKQELINLAQTLNKAIILLKGQKDKVVSSQQIITIVGGHPGMTKGGTGDVLAGLVAALYANNEALTSSVVASYINKKAGEKLAQEVGPFFNASDLQQKIPSVLWQEVKMAGVNNKGDK